jgi:hypothetical protein
MVGGLPVPRLHRMRVEVAGRLLPVVAEPFLHGGHGEPGVEELRGGGVADLVDFEPDDR